MTAVRNEREKKVAAQVVQAIHDTSPEETLAWGELASLSQNTRVDSVEVFEDEIRLSGEHFEGPVVWHVTLYYGKDDDRVTMAETFPGKVTGHVDGDDVKIDTVSADVSAFYQ